MTGDEEEDRVGEDSVGEELVGGGRVGEEGVGGGADKVEREQMEEGEELMDGEAVVMEVELNFFLSTSPKLI